MRIPIASEGWRFILPLAVIGGGLITIRQKWALWLGGFFLLAAFFCAFFFRDFDRVTPKDELAIYSPGDGKVLEVSRITEGAKAGQWLIRIFLSVMDVHVQRSPVEGRVISVKHKPGKFLDARDPKAHVENEQNTVILATDRGPVEVTQIAGLIARRIVCWAQEGAQLSQGERYGLIRFGSQVDLILPASVEPRVNVGDRVWCGTTVVAQWRKK